MTNQAQTMRPRRVPTGSSRGRCSKTEATEGGNKTASVFRSLLLDHHLPNILTFCHLRHLRDLCNLLCSIYASHRQPWSAKRLPSSMGRRSSRAAARKASAALGMDGHFFALARFFRVAFLAFARPLLFAPTSFSRPQTPPLDSNQLLLGLVITSWRLLVLFFLFSSDFLCVFVPVFGAFFVLLPTLAVGTRASAPRPSTQLPATHHGPAEKDPIEANSYFRRYRECLESVC